MVADDVSSISETLQEFGLFGSPIALEEEHRPNLIILQSFEQTIGLVGRGVVIKGQEDRIAGFIAALLDLPVAAPHINIPLE